ncbi:PREDICTED: uncharacterized protein LOC107072912 [Polistes dominula]|uniref:Uncharacterized protein LOC107072912 n=1 Tax=Polistes dominula TaxID=743375 RepID=A0ABM1J8C6_POLDO|nr:PREDICTED: uncharacterized protein LOC107072912 [Polistes dominula]
MALQKQLEQLEQKREVGGVDSLNPIIERYFAIGDKFYSGDTAAVSNTNGSHGDDGTTNTRDQQIRLRRIEIPKFDGDIGKWIQFKRSFMTLVDARTDMSDLEKHIYFREALTGRALQTIATYAPTGQNYKNAWEILLKTFDRQRMLLARAIDAFIDTPRPKNMSIEEMTRLAGDLRANADTITSFNIPHALMVRLGERILPRDLRQEWDKQLDADNYPTMNQLCDFVNEYTLRSVASSNTPSTSGNEPHAKRRHTDTMTLRPLKRQETHITRTFLTRTLTNCLLCKRDKHLFTNAPGTMT